MAKVTTFYEWTWGTKTTCQNVVALTAAELEFTMAGSEKTADIWTHFGLEFFFWNFRENIKKCLQVLEDFLIYFKNFECMKNFAVKDGFLWVCFKKCLL